MNHSEKSSAVVSKIVLFLSLISLASVYLINGTLSPVRAQAREREFFIQIPQHLPIKVQIKKEKENAIKDLSNEKWVRDFELEITNTGTKPIYFLNMLLIAPEVRAPDGTKMGFAITYGNMKRGPVDYQASPEDVPLQPGETYVFSFPEAKQLNWERFRQRENKPDAKRLILHFELLSFGDGTGFFRTDGVAVPRATQG
jgi:hypothetical protein